MRKIIYLSVVGLMAGSVFSAEGAQSMRENAAEQVASKPVQFCAVDSFGLTNSGNACFLNAAMQAVFVCEPLRDFILGLGDGVLKEGSRPFVLAVQRFINAMVAEGKDGAYINTGSRLTGGLAHDVLQYIKTGPCAPNWASTEDGQDAEEFLTLMLDKISEAFAPGNEREKQYFDSIITTKLRTTVNGRALDVESYFISPLSIAQSCQDLQTLLRDNMDVNNAEVHIKPVQLPKVLIVKLGRCDDGLKKLRTPVTPNEKLRLSEGDITVSYALKAVIVHDGKDITSGDYYTYQRVREDWWKRNDQTTEQLSALPSDATTDGYIFFYERIED